MKEKTLVILAAGMGSRFGGLKQAEKFGPKGEYIIDYSIYDAIRCGFNKVVFIIKEENYDLFRDTVGKRVENHINVEYVFQNNDNIPSKYNVPEDRVKPFGTAHAILCAKSAINGPFLMINSDDFYGYDAFKVASEFMNEESHSIAVIGYKVTNTLTENGSVKRGILVTDNGKLKELVESKVERVNGLLEAKALSNDESVDIGEDSLVSMNMIAFPSDFINYVDEKFVEFLDNSDLSKDEYLIPDLVAQAIKENRYNVVVNETNSKWVGVTYKEDKDSVVNYIKELIDKGVYKEDLWS